MATEYEVPPTPAPSPALSSHSGAVSITNYSTEEKDEQTYKDLCISRIHLLRKHYHLLKDTLHKAMGIADMWWGADNVNDQEQQATLGTKLIDGIIQPYCVATKAFIDRHQDRFDIDEAFRVYFDTCAYSVLNCFNPAQGMDHFRAYDAKGLAVRLAKVAEIRISMSKLRKDYGRKILLEKGVRDYGFEHKLKQPEESPRAKTWSLLWAESTKPEDVKLWSIVPCEDLQMHKREAFERIKDERVHLLENKIDTVEDFWDSKLELAKDEDSSLETDDDEQWAGLFEDSFASHFEGNVRSIKLRLMKEFNLFNFRFLGALTDRVAFDEDLQLRTLQGMERKDWPAFVQYRIQLLRVEKGHVESMQFVPMDDADE